MRLKANGRYAVAAMIDLAEAPEGHTTNLRIIAQRQAISLSYLEQIFTRLRRKGIVNSYKGPGGGYQLGRAKDDITIAEILEAVDGSINATQCQGKKNCRNGEKCASHDLWSKLNFQVEQFLHGITLATLIYSEIDMQAIDNQ